MIQIIEEMYYKHGCRIQHIADTLGISSLEVSSWLEYGKPDEPEFKSVGPPNDRLYLQGKCKTCEIPLFGGEQVTREYCGECDPR